jgi:predicted small lipoprotein YifL
VLLAVSALALSGCGRKGPLDLPPTGSQPQSQSSGSQSSSSSGYQPSTSAAEPTDTDAQRAATPSVFNSTYGADSAPVAGKGPKRPFFMDPLLNSN